MKSIKKYVVSILAISVLTIGMTPVCHAWFFNTKVNVDTSKTNQTAGRDNYSGTKNSFNRTNSNNIGGSANNSIISGAGGVHIENNGTTTVSGNNSIGSAGTGKKGIAQNVGNKIGDVTGVGNTANSGQNLQFGNNYDSHQGYTDNSDNRKSK